MHKYLWFLLVIAFTFLGSCKRKELPDPETAQPVFYARGTAGISPVRISAGIGDYYLFTSYYTDNKQVLNFKGSLRPKVLRGFQITMEIKDTRFRNGVSPEEEIEQIFNPGNLSYYLGQDSIHIVDSVEVFQFNPSYEPVGSYTYYWDFGDGTSSVLASPQKTFLTSGDHQVCLTTTDTYGSSRTVCNIIKENPACRVQFEDSLQPPTTLLFEATPGFLSYLWNYGDSSIPVGGNSSAMHTYDTTGMSYVFRVVLQATGVGCQSNFAKDIKATLSNRAAAGFNYSSTYTPITQSVNDSAFHQVSIFYTDSLTGKSYSSFLAGTTPDQSGSYFTITERKKYKANEKGEKTISFKSRIRVRLYENGNPANSILLNIDDCSWAVAYP